MGESPSTNSGSIQSDDVLSEGRIVRTDQPDPTACASIPANVAEGCGQGSDAEFARFLQIAMGSASELEYHLLLARDLNLLNSSVYNQLAGQVTEVKRMLTSLIQKLTADR